MRTADEIEKLAIQIAYDFDPNMFWHRKPNEDFYGIKAWGDYDKTRFIALAKIWYEKIHLNLIPLKKNEVIDFLEGALLDEFKSGETPCIIVKAGEDLCNRFGIEPFKEICICAAVKTKCGKIIRGHRHSDCMEAIIRRGFDMIKMADDGQGFITSKNRFVTRLEGRKLQNAAGIPSADKDGYRGDLLFSEDLY